MPLLADDATLDVLGKAVLGVVQQHMAARCPRESPSDVIFNVFNDTRHDPATLVLEAPLLIPYCERVHHVNIPDTARC